MIFGEFISQKEKEEQEEEEEENDDDEDHNLENILKAQEHFSLLLKSIHFSSSTILVPLKPLDEFQTEKRQSQKKRKMKSQSNSSNKKKSSSKASSSNTHHLDITEVKQMNLKTGKLCRNFKCQAGIYLEKAVLVKILNSIFKSERKGKSILASTVASIFDMRRFAREYVDSSTNEKVVEEEFEPLERFIGMRVFDTKVHILMNKLTYSELKKERERFALSTKRKSIRRGKGNKAKEKFSSVLPDPCTLGEESPIELHQRNISILFNLENRQETAVIVGSFFFPKGSDLAVLDNLKLKIIITCSSSLDSNSIEIASEKLLSEFPDLKYHQIPEISRIRDRKSIVDSFGFSGINWDWKYNDGDDSSIPHNSFLSQYRIRFKKQCSSKKMPYVHVYTKGKQEPEVITIKEWDKRVGGDTIPTLYVDNGFLHVIHGTFFNIFHGWCSRKRFDMMNEKRQVKERYYNRLDDGEGKRVARTDVVMKNHLKRASKLQSSIMEFEEEGGNENLIQEKQELQQLSDEEALLIAMEWKRQEKDRLRKESRRMKKENRPKEELTDAKKKFQEFLEESREELKKKQKEKKKIDRMRGIVASFDWHLCHLDSNGNSLENAKVRETKKIPGELQNMKQVYQLQQCVQIDEWSPLNKYVKKYLARMREVVITNGLVFERSGQRRLEKEIRKMRKQKGINNKSLEEEQSKLPTSQIPLMLQESMQKRFELIERNVVFANSKKLSQVRMTAHIKRQRFLQGELANFFIRGTSVIAGHAGDAKSSRISRKVTCGSHIHKVIPKLCHFTNINESNTTKIGLFGMRTKNMNVEKALVQACEKMRNWLEEQAMTSGKTAWLVQIHVNKEMKKIMKNHTKKRVHGVLQSTIFDNSGNKKSLSMQRDGSSSCGVGIKTQYVKHEHTFPRQYLLNRKEGTKEEKVLIKKWHTTNQNISKHTRNDCKMVVSDGSVSRK